MQKKRRHQSVGAPHADVALCRRARPRAHITHARNDPSDVMPDRSAPPAGGAIYTRIYIKPHNIEQRDVHVCVP
jgi:hypothetical protein